MSKKTTIVFLSAESDIRGGGERFLVDVVTYLVRDYHILCVCREEGLLSDILRRRGAEIVVNNVCWSRKWKYSITQYVRLFSLLTMLTKRKVDIIYANSGHCNPFALRLSRIMSLPLVTHIHDFFLKCNHDRYGFAQSSVLIACASAVAHLVFPFNTNVRVICNGVDSAVFNRNRRNNLKGIRKRYGCADNYIVGTVGTISEKKGHFIFLDVARLLVNKIPYIHFVIMGETKPGEEEIKEHLHQRIREYHLEDRVIFTGFLEEAWYGIADFDVLLFPPRYEAFGRVIIEAFASGVPVVSTFVSGPREIIEHGRDGFLFAHGDIEGMSNAIETLFRNKDQADRIREAAYQKFLSEYTLERMAERIKETIEEMIKRHRR